MAVDASAVRVAVTGAVSKGAYGTTAPSGTGSALAPRVDLGGISEDGVTMTLAETGERVTIKVWQNGQTVRVIRSESDSLATVQFTMVETSKEAVETYWGVTVTQTSTEGSFEYKNANRAPSDYVLDVIDGNELIRCHIPQGVVSAVGEVALTNTTAIGWQVTIDCEVHPTLDYSIKMWMTALGTGSGSSSSSSSSS